MTFGKFFLKESHSRSRKQGISYAKERETQDFHLAGDIRLELI